MLHYQYREMSELYVCFFVSQNRRKFSATICLVAKICPSLLGRSVHDFLPFFLIEQVSCGGTLFGLKISVGQGCLLNRPLCLSVLPDRAGLFWSIEEVTITERVCYRAWAVGVFLLASAQDLSGTCFTLMSSEHKHSLNATGLVSLWPSPVFIIDKTMILQFLYVQPELVAEVTFVLMEARILSLCIWQFFFLFWHSLIYPNGGVEEHSCWVVSVTEAFNIDFNCLKLSLYI